MDANSQLTQSLSQIGEESVNNLSSLSNSGYESSHIEKESLSNLSCLSKSEYVSWLDTEGSITRNKIHSDSKASLYPDDLNGSKLISASTAALSKGHGMSNDIKTVLSKSEGVIISESVKGKKNEPKQCKDGTAVTIIQDPLCPLRLTFSYHDVPTVRYVEGITDDNGTHLLPESKRHILQGMVYDKNSKSIHPPVPKSMMIGRTMQDNHFGSMQTAVTLLSTLPPGIGSANSQNSHSSSRSNSRHADTLAPNRFSKFLVNKSLLTNLKSPRQ